MVDWSIMFAPVLLALCIPMNECPPGFLTNRQGLGTEAPANLTVRLPAWLDEWGSPLAPNVAGVRFSLAVPDAEQTEAASVAVQQDRQSELDMGLRGSSETLPELGAGKDGWPQERSLSVSVTSSLFLFGQVRNEAAVVTPPNSRRFGDTGLGWKLSLPENGELQLCCGPEFIYGDAVRGDHAALLFQSQLVRLEVLYRWTLLGEVNLECQGSASPAFLARDREWIDHEVRVVLPVGRGGQLRLGAKHSLESSGDLRQGAESVQLYGGLRLVW
jgi:hypothetical protein